MLAFAPEARSVQGAPQAEVPQTRMAELFTDGARHWWTAPGFGSRSHSSSDDCRRPEAQKLGSRKSAPVVRLRSVNTPPTVHGLTNLVDRLRDDNTRLREALLAAQRQAEEAERKSGVALTVDFGHLLSLVRDFGDGLGGGCGSADAEAFACGFEGGAQAAAQVFSMDAEDEVALARAPKLVKALASENALEQTRMQNRRIRRKLVASRREVAELRAKLLLAPACAAVDDSEESC